MSARLGADVRGFGLFGRASFHFAPRKCPLVGQRAQDVLRRLKAEAEAAVVVRYDG
jgi:hypothetical protein